MYHTSQHQRILPRASPPSSVHPECVTHRRLPPELRPEDDEDEKNEHGDDRARHEPLLVHPAPAVRTICATHEHARARAPHKGTYRRIIFFSVPDARSIDVSARCSVSRAFWICSRCPRRLRRMSAPCSSVSSAIRWLSCSRREPSSSSAMPASSRVRSLVAPYGSSLVPPARR